MARRSDSDALPRVHRCDRVDMAMADLLPPQRQADGSLLISGYFVRPGVYVYRDILGGTQRELVRRDEIVRSAVGMPRKSVTLEHPDEDVSPDNVAEVGVGDVGEAVKVYQDTGYARVELVLRRSDAIEAFESGRVVELSPGYTCDLDLTPGVDPEFGPYDAVQTNRVYNHLALCTRARGGPTIRARSDSANVAIQIPASEAPVKLLTLAAPLLTRLGTLAGKPVRLDADGAPDLASASEALASLEANAPAAAAALASVEQMKKDLDTLRATVAAKEAELAKLTGPPSPGEIETEMELAAEGDPMMDAKGAPAPLPEAMPAGDACAPVRMDAIGRTLRRLASERAQLEGLAVACRIDAEKLPTMGNRSLRKAILKVAAPTARQDGSRDYDRATIDHLLAGRRTDSADDSYAELARLTAASRTDAEREDAPAEVDPLARYNRPRTETRTETRTDRHARA